MGDSDSFSFSDCEYIEGMTLNTFKPMKLFTALAALTLIATPVNAATVTYQQKRQCIDVPATSARTAGFIQVGNQTQMMRVAAKPATQKCVYITSHEQRTITVTEGF